MTTTLLNMCFQRSLCAGNVRETQRLTILSRIICLLCLFAGKHSHCYHSQLLLRVIVLCCPARRNNTQRKGSWLKDGYGNLIIWKMQSTQDKALICFSSKQTHHCRNVFSCNIFWDKVSEICCKWVTWSSSKQMIWFDFWEKYVFWFIHGTSIYSSDKSKHFGMYFGLWLLIQIYWQ